VLQGQLTDVGLRQVARHWQADGRRGCLREHDLRGTSDTNVPGLFTLGPPAEHALISLLTLNGLRVSEATGTDIEHPGLERGHRTLTCHSSWASTRTAPASRSRAAGLGKTPTTSVRRLISLFSRSSGLVTGMKMPGAAGSAAAPLSAGCWLAYGATVRDRGAGSEAGWAGRSCSMG
jgi:hypothetical protein